MQMTNQAVIRLYAMEPAILTTQQFEALQKELVSRALADDITLGDRILARMVLENLPRYHEAKRQNDWYASGAAGLEHEQK